MNLRTPALLLVTLATFGVLWLASRGGGSVPGAGAPAGQPLFGSSPLAVRVERGAEATVFRREGGYWSQVSPVWFPLSEAAGREITRTLAGAVTQQIYAPGEGPTPREASLDPPRAVVEVVDDSGVTRVALGESMPGGRSFAQVEESEDARLRGRLITLPDGLHTFVYARRDAGWFDPRVPLPPLGAVVEMALRGEGERASVTLLRDRDRWRLADDGAPVRPGVIETMRELTDGLYARELLEGGAATARPAVFGLSQPAAAWDLIEEGGRRTTLLLGRTAGVGDDSVFARLERREGSATLRSPILRLPPTVSALAGGRATIADDRVFTAEAAEVTSLRLEPPAGGPSPVLFERDAEGRFVAVGGAAADTQPTAVLEALLSLRGERRLRPPERLYHDGTSEAAIASPGDADDLPRGYAGAVTLAHGVSGRSATLLVRRWGNWVIRVPDDAERAEYVLDEASEAVLERVIAPLLRGAAEPPGR
ncbi:hypothetical protein [Phycisphaera mikurensis]|uniref:DUF4340 domain-containing protein n=1 Tax=Phycisphaera mikurensis (strain NBRC 102666 / KCTC 22515 / FYK2301M01) TaxID=1142394 RepID=I0IIG8_PHYMF|nr:hypothetical protein [Phycisphaera mikurensis]MBB6442788.1 hypothetical protein [Phycisphaera mikurensis]BAM05056.1 hypothetical protein PSMK_28970 [Phycisphaera mikurensis NBRC 102666]